MTSSLPSLPKFFYKYRPINSDTLDAIENCRIFFSSPADFNDPFDGRIPLVLEGTHDQWQEYLQEIVKREHPKLSPAQRMDFISSLLETGALNELKEYDFNPIIDAVGVLCLSTVPDDILMWSHYSQKHSGVCLQYLSTSKDNFFLRAQKVSYREHFPTTSVFDEPNARMEAQILTKSSHWEYESEWRILAPGGARQLQQHVTSALVGVIVGCRASEKDLQAVREAITRSQANPKLFQAKQSARKFSLEITDAI